MLAVLAVLFLSGCARPPLHDGPIVLITFEALRADAVGALGGPQGLMPHLDEVARQADWVGRGIAPSSGSVPSLGTLLTGLRPWQHQAIHEGRPVLSQDLQTLAEALRERGYTTAGYPGDPWAQESYGFSQGFDAFTKLGRGRRALDRLANLGSGRHFVWVHLPEPGMPYVRYDQYISRLGPGAPELPRRLQETQLEPFFDPEVPLSPGLRRRFLAMYRLNAAWADERLGQLLTALRASGQWSRTLLVVTSIHGEEIGEHGQILHGGNLGRAGLEVPLIIKLPIKLPHGSPLRLRPPAVQRVATARLWATLVEAVGGAPVPAAAPSLCRDAPAEAVSELYLTNGTNRFSLVETDPAGDLQLLQESRFAAPEPGYFQARQAALWRAAPPSALFARLAQAFDRIPPFAGDGGAGGQRWSLERWLPGGGIARVARVEDPRKTAEMARRLAAAWHRSVPDEQSPEGESSEWRNPEKRHHSRWRKRR
ncbi:MAG TPA: sulfatase-like hydrolase/transferase [Thermoanaerobaculia bacterium]|nr:sulfatase-like hydrolase/transferase [Thermoanaerobaculia bacterium]